MGSSSSRRCPLDEPERRPTSLEGRRHVEEDQLVGAELRVAVGELDRVANVAKPCEADALDDAAARDVEARDHALLDHASALASSRAPVAPLRSGWNWTPAIGAGLDGGDDGAAVVDDGCDDAVVGGHGREPVGEVDVRTVEPAEERRRPVTLERVPAHVRHTPRAEPATRPASSPRPDPPSSLALEEQLHADADPECRPARRSALAQRVGEAVRSSRQRRCRRGRRRPPTTSRASRAVAGSVAIDGSAPARWRRTRRCAGSPRRSRRAPTAPRAPPFVEHRAAAVSQPERARPAAAPVRAP